jgi:hypothetical protein
MKKAFLFLVDYAKQNNISFEDAARRYLQSNGVFQSAVKDYILRAGRIPNVGIIEQAKQAGILVLENAGPYMGNFLELEPGQIPTLYRKFNFYGFANEFPVVFIACVTLAGTESEKKVSNYYIFESAETTAKRKAAEKQLKEWAQEKLDQAGDFVKRTFKSIKDVAGDVALAAKKVAFAPFRGAFLLLVRFNVFNLARQFNRAIIADRQTTKNFWENEIGGDFGSLVSAVNLGKKEMPILPGKSQTFTGKYNSLDPVSAGTTATVAAPVTGAAKAFLISMKPVIAKALAAALKSKIAAGIGTGAGAVIANQIIDELTPNQSEEDLEKSREQIEALEKSTEEYKKVAEEIGKNLGLIEGTDINNTFPTGTVPGSLPGFTPRTTPGQPEAAKTTNLLIIVGGALVAAFLIFKKK